MKVYSPHPKQSTGVHSIHVTPGRKNPETAEFMTTNEKGESVPQQFRVEFVNGVAEVTDALGKWMIDNNHAAKSKRLIKTLNE